MASLVFKLSTSYVDYIDTNTYKANIVDTICTKINMVAHHIYQSARQIVDSLCRYILGNALAVCQTNTNCNAKFELYRHTSDYRMRKILLLYKVICIEWSKFDTFKGTLILLKQLDRN